MGTDIPTPASLRLRHLPLPARLVLSVFLISVGCGYVAALWQLHMQHASPGSFLPTGDDAVRIFHPTKGERPQSKLEVLLEAPEERPFNGMGQMCAAFTTKSTKPEWEPAITELAMNLTGKEEDDLKDEDKECAEKQLRAERDGERLALIAWVRAGAKKADYDRDGFVLPNDLIEHPITKKFVKDGEKEKTVTVTSILTTRCFRCHKQPDGVGKAKEFPLNDFAKLKPYVQVLETPTGMPLDKLAQSTHVHLLGFSMLYGLTGLIFAFTSYPLLVRIFIAPLPLVAQLVDISCWWLARLNPGFAQVIVVTGGLVAAGLMLHILLTLFNLYGKAGKGIIVLLLVAGALGGWQIKQRFVDPYMVQETAKLTAGDK